MLDPHVLDVAYCRKTADTVITNGKLVNVLTGEVYPADVSITNGKVTGLGDVVAQQTGPDTEIIDAEGRYLTPGLIDGHLHLECSKLSPTMFADLVCRYGTTSVLSGLDQILVVNGIDGVKEFLAEMENAPMRIWWGAPAKAPYTVPESNVGHRFGPEQHVDAQPMPECVGIWEVVQEFVEHGDPEVMQALNMAQISRLAPFGCSPLVDKRRTAGYAAAGIALCHESYSPEEELEKMRNGINILIRESTAAPMLDENIKLVTELGAPADRVGFCTDDVNSTDILGRGHLDYVVRRAVEAGVDPVTAIQMGTINTARMYNLDRQIGAIAPGRYADIIMVDDLADFRPHTVLKGGKIVAVEGKSVKAPQAPERSAIMRNTFKLDPVKASDFLVHAQGTKATVRAIMLSSEVMFHRQGADVELDIIDGVITPSVEHDTAYLTVVERYGKTNNRPVAFVQGFGLAKGAIATSASPDDNNIVCAGMSASDMEVAINEVIRMDGGQVAVVDGEVVARLELPVGGIVADITAEEMAAAEKVLDTVAHEMGSKLPQPFTQLFFLPITAIPDWAMTDLGLIDCRTLEVFEPVMEVK